MSPRATCLKYLTLLALVASASARDIQYLEMSRPEGARHYFAVQPARTATAKRPLVILLHGHGGSAKQLLGQGIGAAPLSAWLDIADRDGVLLVAPEGLKGNDNKQGWNDCRADAPFNPRSDDLRFLAQLIDSAIAKHGADPQRIYVMGMSNGGMMALRLAVELPERVTAVAAVGASMPVKSACKSPTTPVSVMIIAGDADPLVPYAGGDVGFRSQPSRGKLQGIEQSVAFWRELSKLPAPPSVMSYPHLQDDDKTSAQRLLWGTDPKREQVALISVFGGGHVEPSKAHRITDLYAGIVGPQNADIESAAEAWGFFRDKVRRTHK